MNFAYKKFIDNLKLEIKNNKENNNYKKRKKGKKRIYIGKILNNLL